MDRITTPIAYSTSGSLIVFGFTLNDIAAIIGILLGVATFVLNWYYKHMAVELQRKGTDAQKGTDFHLSSLD